MSCGEGEAADSAQNDIDEALSSLRRFLSVRERSESEIRTRLIQKGIRSHGLIATVMERLRIDGFLNNERFALNRIESRINRGYGPIYIKHELSALRIESDTVSGLLSLFPDERFIPKAIEYIEAKLPGLIRDEDARTKITSGLMRRGFSKSQIDEAMVAIRNRYPHWGRRGGAREK